jgi:hypothetical protein
MAGVVPLDRARLRRAVESGEVESVLLAVEAVLRGPWAVEGRTEAAEALAGVFWTALEDEALGERAGALDMRLAALGAS